MCDGKCGWHPPPDPPRDIAYPKDPVRTIVVERPDNRQADPVRPLQHGTH
jgi:hypothetical protein